MTDKCPACNGLGYIIVVQEMSYDATCPNCNGHGKVFKEDEYDNIASRKTSKG